MWARSNRVLEWFYWLLNRVRTFQYWQNWEEYPDLSILISSKFPLNFHRYFHIIEKGENRVSLSNSTTAEEPMV